MRVVRAFDCESYIHPTPPARSGQRISYGLCFRESAASLPKDFSMWKHDEARSAPTYVAHLTLPLRFGIHATPGI